MIQWHSGKAIGPVGVLLVFVSGIALVVLSVTGGIVYYDMWRRRKSAGKTGLFWK